MLTCYVKQIAEYRHILGQRVAAFVAEPLQDCPFTRCMLRDSSEPTELEV